MGPAYWKPVTDPATGACQYASDGFENATQISNNGINNLFIILRYFIVLLSRQGPFNFESALILFSKSDTRSNMLGKNAIFRHIFVLLLIGFFGITTFAAIPEELNGFDAFVEKAMVDFKVPGVSVAIVKNNQVIWTKGYGHRDVEKKLPVTPDTLFAIGSITKSFTASAIGMLVDEGKLDWDKPVRNYLPDFRMYTEEGTKSLTLRDLLTHRSGLPRHDLVWYTSDLSRENLVQRLRYLETNKPIRYVFQYNNLMYITAGYLAGKQAGTSWEDLVQNRLFKPLGMTRTNFLVDVKKSKDFAKPYRKSQDTEEVRLIDFYPLFAEGPAGSINSTATDMSNYIIFQLNQGKWKGKQLLSQNNASEMQKRQMVLDSFLPFPEFGNPSYGLGFFISSYRGHRIVEHGGNIDGFSAAMSMLPNDDIGVVVLANLDGTSIREVISFNVLDRLIKLEPIPWSERFLNMEKQGKASEKEAKAKGYTPQIQGTKPSHELADYVGDYQNPGYGTMSISKKDDKLHLTMGRISKKLEHFHYDVFQIPEDHLDPFSKLKALFQADMDGHISLVSLPLEVLVSNIVFTRLPDRQMLDPKFLKTFVGEYEMPGMPAAVTISLEGDTLTLNMPGQPSRALIPKRGTTFDLAGLNGFQIEFKQNEAVLNQMGTLILLKKKKP